MCHGRWRLSAHQFGLRRSFTMMITLVVHILLIFGACSGCFFDSDCPSGQVCKHELTDTIFRDHCEIDARPSTAMTLVYVFVVAPIAFFTFVAVCVITCKFVREGPRAFDTWFLWCRRENAPTYLSHASQVPRPAYLPMQTNISVDSLPPPYAEAVASASSLSIIGTGPQASDRRQLDVEKLQ